MSHHFLDAIITEYYNGSAWVDISAYVVGDIRGNNGLGGWKPDQRVAALGTLNITLNNKGKLFTPMGGDSSRGLSTLSGFNKGAKIRILGLFGSPYYPIWTGRIASIDSDDKNWGNEQVRVMAVDWMEVPSKFPMKGATIALNKRIDEVMPLVLARLSIQPENTNFDTGLFTFPAVFDNVQRKTMSLSEFTKLANSELGYIYVKHDGTLVAENMLTRQGWRALDQVWVVPETENFLLMEDGNFLLTEEGGKIILDEGAYEDVHLSTDAESYSISLPEDSQFNASIIRAYPVITDTSLKVLYKLGTPLFIPAGQTATFSAHYTDPSGLAQVSGTNMQTPVATTDYLANTAADGSGTNKTSDQVVTATYYGDIVYYSIANNATTGVYITFLQARGYGIYYGNSIESTVEDTVSQLAFGYYPFQLDMKYQKDTYLAEMYGKSVIDEYKIPKSRITNMKFLANLNHNHMIAFLAVSIGALIALTEDRSNITNHYYVTDRIFTIKQGGIINVEYGLKQNDSYLSGGLQPVNVQFAGGTSKDAINYGYLPQVSGDHITNRAFSAWVYVNAIPDHAVLNVNGIISPFTDENGVSLYAAKSGAGNYAVFVFYSKRYTDTGGWYANVAYNPGALYHVLVFYDHSSTANDAVFYINGASVAVVESQTPAGTLKKEIGCPLVIGNWKTNTIDYAQAIDGKIFDPRIYDMSRTTLTQAQLATALYNGGVPSATVATEGLVFQGNSIYTDRAGDLPVNHTLASTDRLTENILRVVGVPSGAPIIRANP